MKYCTLFYVLSLFHLQNGNITELLLKEGFARCVDWSMAVYTQGAEKLRAGEKSVPSPTKTTTATYIATRSICECDHNHHYPQPFY